jgi:hypothetical protein
MTSALIRVGITLAALASTPAAEAQHRHPVQDAWVHEQFYSTWRMPDRPYASCCNKGDCYPTEIRVVGGAIFAKRREDGKFIAVPAAKIERHRDNPDGRSHLCAPPPTATAYAPDTVFCFSLGLGM